MWSSFAGHYKPAFLLTLLAILAIDDALRSPSNDRRFSRGIEQNGDTMAMDNPFSLPDTLSPTLQKVISYWQGLKRAGNSMPFWDDVKLSELPADCLLLIDAFTDPDRFRINTIGKEAGDADALRGKFIDETPLSGRLGDLQAQCSATVEARTPTFYRHKDGSPYTRILLPMWGDGRIGMLLGAIEPV